MINKRHFEAIPNMDFSDYWIAIDAEHLRRWLGRGMVATLAGTR
jgi:ribosomal protein S18 acetylase RimI-like enzyme